MRNTKSGYKDFHNITESGHNVIKELTTQRGKGLSSM